MKLWLMDGFLQRTLVSPSTVPEVQAVQVAQEHAPQEASVHIEEQIQSIHSPVIPALSFDV